MSMEDNSPGDEPQLATVPTHYLALLAMTRPLVIREHTLPFWRGGQTCRLDLRIPRGSGNWRAEWTLRKGEILRPGRSELEMAGDKDLATTREEDGASFSLKAQDAETEYEYRLAENSSNLQIRIYLGMS
jgi:hypothetical protein